MHGSFDEDATADNDINVVRRVLAIRRNELVDGSGVRNGENVGADRSGPASADGREQWPQSGFGQAEKRGAPVVDAAKGRSPARCDQADMTLIPPLPTESEEVDNNEKSQGHSSQIMKLRTRSRHARKRDRARARSRRLSAILKDPVSYDT